MLVMSDYSVILQEVLEGLSKAELIAIIRKLEERIMSQDKRIESLERHLGLNSRNSSKPPSSNGPEVPPAEPKAGSGRKRGGQPGHAGHIREFLPSDKVSEAVEHKPTACRRCGMPLSGEDPNPARYQVWEIPPLAPVVTEHRFHSLRCACGELTTARSSEVVRDGMFGPNLTALASLLTGGFHLSRRSALEIMNTVFKCPMSLGGLSSCEEAASESLAEPVSEIREAVLSSPVVHADETSFRLGNRMKGWLWVAAGGGLAFFLLHAKRGFEGAKALLGSFRGVLIADRWRGYNRHPGRRQHCWAHVKRDFTRISEMSGEAGEIGRTLLDMESRLFEFWHRVRDGTMTRPAFRNEVRSLRRIVKEFLLRGTAESLACSGMCRELLKTESRLWTFVRVPGVEPTNNTAERSIRPAVLWRKISFGVQSERGRKFVERMLTVRASCRLRGVSVVEFVKNAVAAKRNGRSAPSLLIPENQPIAS
jgi:transposase